MKRLKIVEMISGAAEKFCLMPGDYIDSIDGIPMDSERKLTDFFTQYSGASFRLRIIRKFSVLDFTVKEARLGIRVAEDELPQLPANRKLKLVLSSQQQLLTARVMLFPEPAIQAAAFLRLQAQEELAGFSSGLGFWGRQVGRLEGQLSSALLNHMFPTLKQKMERSY